MGAQQRQLLLVTCFTHKCAPMHAHIKPQWDADRTPTLTPTDSPIVLFLHGAKFSSENWVNLGTLKLIHAKVQPRGRVHSGYPQKPATHGCRPAHPHPQHLAAASPHSRNPEPRPFPRPGVTPFISPGQGYRTAAIDLPGFGQSRNLPYVDNNMRAEFLKSALEFLSKGANVTAVGALLVSPSMSGCVCRCLLLMDPFLVATSAPLLLILTQ